MKVKVEFDVQWDNYDDVCDELIVEDMFENWPGKDGVTIASSKVERTEPKKKEYYISISGEQHAYTTRWLTDAEAEFVGSIIAELDSGPESCFMKEVVSEEELQDISLTAYPEKPKIGDYYVLFKEVDKRYPKEDVLWKDYIAFRALDITNNRKQ